MNRQRKLDNESFSRKLRRVRLQVRLLTQSGVRIESPDVHGRLATLVPSFHDLDFIPPWSSVEVGRVAARSLLSQEGHREFRTFYIQVFVNWIWRDIYVSFYL